MYIHVGMCVYTQVHMQICEFTNKSPVLGVGRWRLWLSESPQLELSSVNQLDRETYTNTYSIA